MRSINIKCTLGCIGEDFKYFKRENRKTNRNSYLFTNFNHNSYIKTKTNVSEVIKFENDKIYQFCKNNSISLSELFFSLFYIYISRIHNIYNTTIYISLINKETAPLLVQTEKNTSIKELFCNIKKAIQVFENNIQLKVLFLSDHLKNGEQSDYLLRIAINETSEQLSLDIITKKNNFFYNNIKSFAASLKTIIDSFASLPLETKIKNIEIVSSSDKYSILNLFNQTKTNYPKNKSIIDIFENIVNKYPNKVALKADNISYTYKELNLKARQLAAGLQLKGCKLEDRIGLLLKRSPDFIIAVLGILKAGGAYVPIDINYPKERINYIIENSDIKIILSEKSYTEKLPSHIHLLSADEWYKNDHNYDPAPIFPDNLAYIMYTSGSTGTPKGVMVEQRNVVRLAVNNGFIDLGPEMNLLMTGSLVFDAITFEIWATLLNGGTLCVTNEDDLLNPHILEKIIKEQNINVLFLTTALFHQLADKNLNLFSSLIYLLVGGDVLSPRYANKVIETFPLLNFLNCYGPTENGSYSTTYKIQKSIKENIPIGKPINNSTAYVVDIYMNILPIGIEGELCVGGDGVGRGYIKNKEATKEKFVDNPFGPGKLYKTGDLAKWDPDGNLLFLGRKDNQVKIRGHRIEFGEIDKVVESHPKIKEHVLITITDEKQNKDMCLYYISDRLKVKDLRIYLKNALPKFMVPVFIVQLEKFPLNPNGKIDRQKLPSPLLHSGPGNIKLPVNDVEIILLDTWEKILGIQCISTDEDFFSLGGHSLKAIHLIETIEQEFLIKLKLSELFDNSTIEKLGKVISLKNKCIIAPIEKVSNQDYYEMSYAQKRLFLLNLIESSATNYNVPIVFRVSQKVSQRKLRYALEKIIERHEILRTTFEWKEETPVQIVHDSLKLYTEFFEADNEIDTIIQDFIRPFSLDKLPLFRIGVIETSNKENIFIFDFHHIIGDGESVQVFLKELSSFYNGEKITDLAIQYKDFTYWQIEQYKKENYQEQKRFWLKELSGELPTLNMPYDKLRPQKQLFNGDEYVFEIKEELTERIQSLNVSSNTTLYMLLLAAYNILLYKYTNQQDILIGTPVRGRQHPDTNNLIGIFINNLVIRNRIDSELSFYDFLQSVKGTVIKAFENQDFQFEELISSLKLEKDLSRNPLFDTIFVVQEILTKSIQVEAFEIQEYDFRHKASKYDIFFEACLIKGKIRCVIGYCTDLFELSTIKRLSTHFTNILAQIVDHPTLNLKEIDILSKSEKELILNKFNNTRINMNPKETIISLFTKQVELSPDHIAVVYNNRQLTYKELDIASNKLANLILSYNIPSKSLIGLMVSRTENLLISQLGILKSGSAYLPIDKEFPKDRIEYMIFKGNMKYLISEEDIALKFNLSINTIFLGKEVFESQSSTPPDIHNDSKDIAYTIFTSGSTGNPKGVTITHLAIANLVKGVTEIIDFSDNKSILALTSISFDIHVLETLLAICAGNKIIIANEETQRDSSLLNRFIIDNKIDLLQITPSRLQLLMMDAESTRSLSVIKTIMIGGETFPKRLFEEIKKYPELNIYNMYGPTETTVWSTIKNLTNSSDITLGNPIANTQIYILDKHLNITPIGVTGELYIGGLGVSPGYYNEPQLTKERFIKNPFIENEYIYKTGDLATWRENGEIVFHGRTDFQIKIRGYRIEPAEIENKLRECEGIDECVILSEKDNLGFHRLIAYYISKNNVPNRELKEQLSNVLPSYMIPDLFIQIESIPLTPNNKIDKKALSKIKIQNIEEVNETDYLSLNHIQKSLLKIWQEILKVNRISINDSFFDLGGNSLLLAVMHNRINKEFSKKISVADIFINSTISKLADFIENTKSNSSEKVQLVSTELPKDYLKNGSVSNYTENVLRYIIKGTTKDKLLEFCKKENINTEFVLLSVFTLILMKIAQLAHITFYLFDKDIIHEINLDFSDKKNIRDIMLMLKNIVSKKQYSRSIRINENIDISPPQPTNNIFPLFIIGKTKKKVFKSFDFKIVYELTDEKDIVITHITNSEYLKSEKSKTVFSNYLNVLHQIIT